ncbi:MAG: hypothetical protein AABW67_03125 [Nanoarchaeota archaeon]
MVIKKDNKSGQAEIITTVLIILMVLVAVVIVWNVVKFTVVRSAENIGTSAFTTQLDLENVELYTTGGASIKIHRGAGEGDITSLKFIFYDSEGESYIIEKDGSDENCRIPDELETKICEFDSSEVNFNVVKVSVIPMFGKSAGIEVVENNPKTDLPVYGVNINSCESTKDWTNIKGNLITSSDKMEGSYSLKLTATTGDNDGYAAYNPSGTWDFRNRDFITFWAKSGNGTELLGIGEFFIEDYTTYCRWVFSYPTNWSLIKLNISNPASCIETIDLSTIDKFRFDVNQNGASGLIDAVRLT